MKSKSFPANATSRLAKTLHKLSSIIYTISLLLVIEGCSSRKEEDVDPQNTATTTTYEYYSQCKVSNYTCYGSSGTALEYESNGNPKYSFVFAMVVDKNEFQQLTAVVSLKSFSGKGKYTLSASNAEVGYIVRPATDTFESTKVTGTLEITDYQPKKLITGKFSIVSSDGTRSLELRDGDFKAKADF